MILYSYFRSSAAYRVRIGLNLKGLDYQIKPVHLLKDGGQQHQPDYVQVNPVQLLPALDDDGLIITQSLAILEYLDERYPELPLLPKASAERAWARSMAQTVACDIHPLNNLRVLQYLKNELHAQEDARNQWYRHWVSVGLEGLEALVQRHGKKDHDFIFGDTPGLAEICLIPQMFNARRFDIDLSTFPRLLAVEEKCLELSAFQEAAPDRQPDAA
ncbi:maleylacetoacetate isomerase [Alcaligenes sp. RM2]|uniref:maleylacetoacetate isomerase n=1 Tax=Alcaligenes TaxID=507 RepID=UPI0002AA66F2|nr:MULTISPECIES: maleylacetoacetate isomerase [Alcaligenes]MDH4868093.1 maleylacetoacetate isomerase [Bacillus cereus]EKU30621.1 maleylacetoacetate isomerase [Alcaligenes sp. HPC1271]ERT55807.1 maleylacetoacetate isomerase [Alcaligenes sp. EGD-AK7]MCX5470801.1 maleylacetoacetate isomerase [Alcaligenes nematophilus]MDY7129405.1 maleylacetoacetate isomerase [Alcaligenes nematophilus]